MMGEAFVYGFILGAVGAPICLLLLDFIVPKLEYWWLLHVKEPLSKRRHRKTMEQMDRVMGELREALKNWNPELKGDRNVQESQS